MNWFDFADKDDIDARSFYGKLVDTKAKGYGWADTWEEVPTKVLHQLHRGAYAGDPDTFWTGLEWVTVLSYETGRRVFLRLPEHGEVAE